ncbi:hypothetical protein CES86_4064 [Brucella lupini]|uniref:Uncharacterized protein n=1 Tax=Brucella lupini TaxID=255457 RepID=A0A256GGF0_9HYPH|nr:hypothetical protein CES86_4064 [Brucella lupini]
MVVACCHHALLKRVRRAIANPDCFPCNRLQEPGIGYPARRQLYDLATEKLHPIS